MRRDKPVAEGVHSHTSDATSDTDANPGGTFTLGNVDTSLYTGAFSEPLVALYHGADH